MINKILFIAPITALHGQGKITKLVFNVLKNHNKLYFLDTHVKGKFSYLIVLFSLLYFLIKNRNESFNYLYFTPSRSNPGLVRDVMLFFFIYCNIIQSKKIISHLHGSDHLFYFKKNNLLSSLWKYLSRTTPISYILLSNSHSNYTYKKRSDTFTIIPNPHFVTQKFLKSKRKKNIKKVIFVSFPSLMKGLDKAVSFCRINNLDLSVYGWTKWDYVKIFNEQPPFNILFNGIHCSESIIQSLPDYDLLVLPSLNEAQPLVVIDALCSYLPVLISPVKMLKDFKNFKGVYFFTNNFNLDCIEYSYSSYIENYRIFSKKKFEHSIKNFFSC